MPEQRAVADAAISHVTERLASRRVPTTTSGAATTGGRACSSSSSSLSSPRSSWCMFLVVKEGPQS